MCSAYKYIFVFSGFISLGAVSQITYEPIYPSVNNGIGKGFIIFNECIPQDLGFVNRENPEEMFNLEILPHSHPEIFINQ